MSVRHAGHCAHCRAQFSHVFTWPHGSSTTFGASNMHQGPKLGKIIVSSGSGRFLENQKIKPEIRAPVISTRSIAAASQPPTSCRSNPVSVWA